METSNDPVKFDITNDVSITTPPVIGITKSEVGWNEIHFLNSRGQEQKLRFQLVNKDMIGDVWVLNEA